VSAAGRHADPRDAGDERGPRGVGPDEPDLRGPHPDEPDLRGPHPQDLAARRPAAVGRDDPSAAWDDDLDTAFGPDTASTATRTRPERLRTATVVVLGVVGVAVVIVVVLGVILSGVQRGVGGVFPQPAADRARFVAAASALPGVAAVERARTEQTSFAGYDVSTILQAEPDLGDDERRALVDAVSAAASDSGSGVRIWATVDFGSVQVGVSDSVAASRQRLALADRLAGIGGVAAVRCVFITGSDGRSDEPAAQSVSVTTPAAGDALVAIAAAAEHAGDDVFPGVQVRTLTS
jgi:hypothetical protein